MSHPPPAHLAVDFAAAGIRDVECLFPDVSGYPRGKLMPATAFASGAELRIAQAIPMQFWDEFRATLDLLGIRTDTWIHEVGLTQFEINLLHDDPVVVADQAFLFKYAAKEVALKHGMNAVFMAKPIAHQPGSSMHLHQSLVDADGRNVFSNADGSESALFRQYTGYASIKEVEYESWLAEIGAWERRFLVAQA